MKKVLGKSVRNTRHCEPAKQSRKKYYGLLRRLAMTVGQIKYGFCNKETLPLQKQMYSIRYILEEICKIIITSG